MSWSIIRKATEADVESLEQRAQAFCDRHEIEVDEWETAVDAVEREINHRSENYLPGAADLKKNWQAVTRRALKSRQADGIAHGYVGFSVQ